MFVNISRKCYANNSRYEYINARTVDGDECYFRLVRFLHYSYYDCVQCIITSDKFVTRRVSQKL